MNNKEDRVVELLKAKDATPFHNAMTKAEIAKELGITEKQAYDYLYQLLLEGRVRALFPLRKRKAVAEAKYFL